MAKIKTSKGLGKSPPDYTQLLMSLLRICVARYVDGRTALVCRIRKSAEILDVKLSAGDDSSILVPMTGTEVQQTLLGIGIREDFRETTEGEALQKFSRHAGTTSDQPTTDTLKRAIIAYSAEIVQGAGQYGRIDPLSDPYVSLQLSSLKRCLQWLEQSPTAAEAHGGKAALLAALQHCSRMTREHLQQYSSQARASGHPSQAEVNELVGDGRMDRVHGRVMLEVAAGMEQELLVAQLQRSPLQMAAMRPPAVSSAGSLTSAVSGSVYLSSLSRGPATAMHPGGTGGSLLSPQGRGLLAGAASGAAAYNSSPVMTSPMPQPGHGSASYNGGLARPAVSKGAIPMQAYPEGAASPHMQPFRLPSLQPQSLQSPHPLSTSPAQLQGSSSVSVSGGGGGSPGSWSPTQRHRHELIALANSHRVAEHAQDEAVQNKGSTAHPSAVHVGRSPVPFPQQAQLPQPQSKKGAGSKQPTMKKPPHTREAAVTDKAAVSPSEKAEAERQARIKARTESVQQLLQAAKEGKADAMEGTAFEEPPLVFRARPAANAAIQAGGKGKVSVDPSTARMLEAKALDDLLRREEELMREYAQDETMARAGALKPSAAMKIGDKVVASHGYGKAGLRASAVGVGRQGAAQGTGQAGHGSSETPSPVHQQGKQQAGERAPAANLSGQYLTYGMASSTQSSAVPSVQVRPLPRRVTDDVTPKPTLLDAAAQQRRAKYDVAHLSSAYGSSSIHSADSLGSLGSYTAASVGERSQAYSEGAARGDTAAQLEKGQTKNGDAADAENGREYIYSEGSSLRGGGEQVRLPSLIPGDENDDRPWMRPLSGVTATSGSPSRQATGGASKPPGHRPGVPVVSWTTGARVDGSPVGRAAPVSTSTRTGTTGTQPLSVPAAWISPPPGQQGVNTVWTKGQVAPASYNSYHLHEPAPVESARTDKSLGTDATTSTGSGAAGQAEVAGNTNASAKFLSGAFSPVRSALDAQVALHSASDMSKEDIAQWARSLVSRSAGAAQASDQYVASLTAGTAVKKAPAATSPTESVMKQQTIPYRYGSRVARADDTLPVPGRGMDMGQAGEEYVPDRSAIKAMAMLQTSGQGLAQPVRSNPSSRSLMVTGPASALPLPVIMSGLHPSIGSTLRLGVQASAAQFGGSSAPQAGYSTMYSGTTSSKPSVAAKQVRLRASDAGSVVDGISKATGRGHVLQPKGKGKAQPAVVMSVLSTPQDYAGGRQAASMPPKPSADGQTVAFTRRAVREPEPREDPYALDVGGLEEEEDLAYE